MWLLSNPNPTTDSTSYTGEYFTPLSQIQFRGFDRQGVLVVDGMGGRRGVEIDPIPKRLFKYLKAEHISFYKDKNSLRFGSQKFYRIEHEGRLLGFNDPYDGSVRQYNPTTRQQCHMPTNSFVFSTSVEWTPDSQFEWWVRQGCNYNACIEFDGKKLITQLAESTELKYPGTGLLIGNSIYTLSGACEEVKAFTIDPFKSHLKKRKTLAWEKEYRFCLSHDDSSEEVHTTLVCPNLSDAFVQISVFDPWFLKQGILKELTQ